MSQAKRYTISLVVNGEDGFHRSYGWEGRLTGISNTDLVSFWMQLVSSLTHYLTTKTDVVQVSSRNSLPDVLGR